MTKTMTEIFIQFLNTELSGKERKAFIDGIKSYYLITYRYDNSDLVNHYVSFSKSFVENFIANGMTSNTYSVCSSLSTFVKYLISYEIKQIIGYGKTWAYYIKGKGYDAHGRNKLIEEMNYDYGSCFRSFHIALYTKKWKDFLKRNVCDYDKKFDPYGTFNTRYTMKNDNG